MGVSPGTGGAVSGRDPPPAIKNCLKAQRCSFAVGRCRLSWAQRRRDGCGQPYPGPCRAVYLLLLATSVHLQGSNSLLDAAMFI